jgi:hypothetical protein
MLIVNQHWLALILNFILLSMYQKKYRKKNIGLESNDFGRMIVCEIVEFWRFFSIPPCSNREIMTEHGKSMLS